jgi:hypothetical protein
VRVEEGLQRAPHRLHTAGFERGFGIAGRESSGQQPVVLLARWDVQVIREAQQEFRAGASLAQFHEAQVPRRHPDFRRQIELAAMGQGASLLDERAYLLLRHAPSVATSCS